MSSPKLWADRDSDHPRPVGGYEKILGRTGEALRPSREHWSRLASQLSRTFRELHTFPLDCARALGVQEAPLQIPSQMLDRYLSGAVELPPKLGGPPALCHADLKGEHFILDDHGRLQGSIDWSDICITDPAVDFAYTFMWFRQEFVRSVIEHYPACDRDGLLRRSAFIGRCHTLIGLGRKLSGGPYGPMPLLKTQLDWAFRQDA